MVYVHKEMQMSHQESLDSFNTVLSPAQIEILYGSKNRFREYMQLLEELHKYRLEKSKKENTMSLLEVLAGEYTRITGALGTQPSIIHLCDGHNRKVAEELKGVVPQSGQLNTPGSRVRTLFHKPVIEETQDGVVKCLLCDKGV
jgi:hypothetical protein